MDVVVWDYSADTQLTLPSPRISWVTEVSYHYLASAHVASVGRDEEPVRFWLNRLPVISSDRKRMSPIDRKLAPT